MQKKTLKKTNPYLKVQENYPPALIINVASSTAIETGASFESIVRKLTKGEKTKKALSHSALLNNYRK